MIKGVTQAVAGFINIYPWLKVIQEDFFFEFKDKKWVQWCNKYLHENSWFLQCASLVLAKRIHFPTKSSWLLIASLQRLRSKEKVISDNWILLKWLSVEHACIFGSLNSVIKLSLFCCKERSALKLFSRERKIRLFLPRRKILLNPYYHRNNQDNDLTCTLIILSFDPSSSSSYFDPSSSSTSSSQ